MASPPVRLAEMTKVTKASWMKMLGPSSNLLTRVLSPCTQSSSSSLSLATQSRSGICPTAAAKTCVGFHLCGRESSISLDFALMKRPPNLSQSRFFSFEEVSSPRTMMKCVIGLLMLAASVNAQSLTACNADKLKSSMTACDSLPNVSQVKCDDKACHSALHYLTEDSAAKCWVELGLGKADDLNKYKELDEFCHGEGHDPAEEGEGHDHEHEHEHEHEHDHSGSGHHHHDAGSNSTSDVTAPATGDASVPTPAPSAAVSTFALSSAALVASAAVIASL